jgi:hypothetical protein
VLAKGAGDEVLAEKVRFERAPELGCGVQLGRPAREVSHAFAVDGPQVGQQPQHVLGAALLEVLLAGRNPGVAVALRGQPRLRRARTMHLTGLAAAGRDAPLAGQRMTRRARPIKPATCDVLCRRGLAGASAIAALDPHSATRWRWRAACVSGLTGP